MLKKLTLPNVSRQESVIEICKNEFLFVETLSTDDSPAKIALFIHGGGVTGNHTLLIRPALHLLKHGIFTKIILPDRRGTGRSSHLKEPVTFISQARDMKLLLDAFNVSSPVTVLAESYGGPIALILASGDARISKVVLLSSSPELILTKGKLKFFYKTGILVPFIKMVISIFAAKGRPEEINFDSVYEIKSSIGYVISALNVLRHTRKENIPDLLLSVDSVFNPHNFCIPEDIKLHIPVYQIIGSKDKAWGETIPDKFSESFPLLCRTLLKGFRHRDLFERADVFIDELIKTLSLHP